MNSIICQKMLVSDDTSMHRYLTLLQCLEINKEAPSAEFEIEHVYGYRAHDCNNNLHYTENGEVAFMTAALGVVMNTTTGRQRVYGGKECPMLPKAQTPISGQHKDDVKAFGISADRKLVATGESRSNSSVHIWDPVTMERTHLDFICVSMVFAMSMFTFQF